MVSGPRAISTLAIGGVLCVAATIAMLVPALRAATVDPSMALKQE